MIDSPTDSVLFRRYVEHMLVGTLLEDNVLVMDSLSSHKTEGVQGAVAQAGASVRYPPPYSSNCNPIESTWSKGKAALRSAA